MASLFTSEDIFLKWRYTVSEIYILYPKEEPVEIPTERLVSLMILNDYENNLYPVFRIEIVLEASRYYKIIKNKDDVKFKLRIQKSYQILGEEEWSLDQDYIQDTFDLILDDEDFDVDAGFKEERAATDYDNIEADDVDDLFSTDNRFEFFLFKSSTIKAGRKTINTILHNATVTDAMNYIASKAGFKNLLMTPADHTDVIDELVIPPLNAAMAMVYVDCYYGLYKTGSLIFMDLDRNYILPYNEKCRCWEAKETKEINLIIPKKSSDFSSDLCTVIKDGDKTKKYIVGNNSTVQIENNSITYDILAGNDIESVNSYDGTVSSGVANSKGSGNNNERQIENMTENPYFNKIYTKQSESRNTVLTMTIGDYDITFLKPNRVINVIFEDSKLTKLYKGKYKIVRANHSFTLTGGQFQLMTDLVLKKMNS